MSMPDAARLFDDHHLAVFRFLRRMTGSLSLAEDLTQEVFLRVVRGIDSYEERSRETSWIFRIARNVLADRRRSQARTPVDAPVHDAVALARPAVQALATALDQALSRLPDDEREAFLMREVGGLGYREIAEACGATADAARMRIYRARLALRQALGPSRSVAVMTPREVSK
jgi:RNA polymerase sigma-70 factor (ECF subfamily)